MGSPDRRGTEPGTVPGNPLALIGSAHEWSSRALASLLQGKGYAVLLAHTGAATQDQARTARPDVILLDTTLSDMDDMELCRILRGDPLIAPRTAIITLSAEAPTEEKRLAALQAGASDVLSSSLLFEEVFRALDAFVGAKRVADQAPE